MENVTEQRTVPSAPVCRIGVMLPPAGVLLKSCFPVMYDLNVQAEVFPHSFIQFSRFIIRCLILINGC